MLVMGLVPFISLFICLILKNYSILWASVLGGMSYGLYPVLISIWHRKFDKLEGVLHNENA
mgnify:CR=1 FL=1